MDSFKDTSRIRQRNEHVRGLDLRKTGGSRVISKMIVSLTMIAASFIIAVIYGNAVIYHGFPEMPNIFLLLMDHSSGESVYDLIYCNAFFCSVLLLALFLSIRKHFREISENTEK